MCEFKLHLAFAFPHANRFYSNVEKNLTISPTIMLERFILIAIEILD